MLARTLVPVFLALLASCATLARADDSIGLNEEHKGTTKANDLTQRHQKLTSDSVTVDLKSGQRVELSVKAIGDDRAVAIIVWDADGKPIASNALPKRLAFGGGDIKLSELTDGNIGDAQHMLTTSKKTAKIVIGEVPSSATYTIKVYSEVGGDYLLTVKDLSKARDVAAIEKELKAARERVDELEKELKEARRSTKPK
jgi:hypothetical protein